MRAGGLAAAALLAALAGCGEPYDPGGDVVAASTVMFAARRDARPVEIRGRCYSACALKLGAGPRVCVAPSATIGVHEVRRAAQVQAYRSGARDNLATGFFEALLPRCARNLFAGLHGFDGAAVTAVSGRAILSACPQIRPCPE